MYFIKILLQNITFQIYYTDWSQTNIQYSIIYQRLKKQRIKVLLFQEKVPFLSQENQDHKGQIA